MAGEWLDTIEDKYMNKEKWQYGQTNKLDADGKVLSFDTNKDGDLEIDCSHFIHLVLGNIGFNASYKGIRYMTTGELNSELAFKYYSKVTSDEVQRGDIVLFGGHVGFVDKYDSKNPGKSVLFASNGRKVGDEGPSRRPFHYFGKPTKFLRPKPEFFMGNQQDNPYSGLPSTSSVISKIPKKIQAPNPALHTHKPRTNQKNIHPNSTITQHPHAPETSIWHQLDYYNTKVRNYASRYYWRIRHQLEN